MPRIRKEFDADLQRSPIEDIATANSRFKIDCSECGRILHTDKQRHHQYLNAMHVDADNQFICGRCTEADFEAGNSYS